MIKTRMTTLLSSLPLPPLLPLLQTTTTTKRKWTWWDLQYVVILTIMTIDFILIKTPTLIPRFILASLLISSFFIPYIRKFTIPAVPIFTWLITFYACQFIPIHYRPAHIFVNLLPTLEHILYGANLSEIISQHTHPVLDILAWLPYGVIHFSFPFVLSALLFIYGPPGSLKVFGKAFGFMNLAGVLTQLFFPNASPWYEIIYGSAPADYSIPGEAGGLLRIDEILGLDLYGSTFGTSPLVFGAFPSLHSGCATIEMLFLSWLFPKMRPVAIFYVLWMWFSTMYLTHHYMIDLVGGSIYAILAFVVAQKFLPKLNSEHHTRLEYLGITKLSIRSFIYSIEHDPRDNYAAVVHYNNDDEEAAHPMKETSLTTVVPISIHSTSPYRHQNNRPGPLLLVGLLNEKQHCNRGHSSSINQEEEQEEEQDTYSPVSSGVWSPSTTSSEPTSPITPHYSPPSSLKNFKKP